MPSLKQKLWKSSKDTKEDNANKEYDRIINTFQYYTLVYDDGTKETLTNEEYQRRKKTGPLNIEGIFTSWNGEQTYTHNTKKPIIIKTILHETPDPEMPSYMVVIRNTDGTVKTWRKSTEEENKKIRANQQTAQ
jgi:hypothetical protein